MKNVNLCGRNNGCCPSIREDTKNKIMYIIDGDQKIPFSEEEVKNLTIYLNKR